MPDTINLPGGGPGVQKKWVLAGGALVAGIVGYAYLRRSRTTTPVVTPPTPSELPPADFSTVSTGGGVTDTGLQFITTNAQWSADATAKLTDLGYDSVAVSTALGKYLASQFVTSQEAQYIYTAIALSGHPPVGAFSVRLEPTPTSGSVPSPGGRGTPAPVKRYTAATASWQGHRVSSRGITLSSLASQFSHSKTPTGIYSTLKDIDSRNPAVANRYGNVRPLPVGTNVLVPIWR